jgi:hypothetical protein
MSSTREIFWERSSLEGMMSSLFSTKRSRFCNQLWLEVKCSIKKDLRISDFLNSKLVITRVN